MDMGEICNSTSGLRIGAHLHESTHVSHCVGQDAGMEDVILKHAQILTDASQTQVVSSSNQPVLHSEPPVIPQVCADARTVCDNWEAKGTEVIGSSDPGQLQKLRRLKCAGTDNDFSR